MYAQLRPGVGVLPQTSARADEERTRSRNGCAQILCVSCIAVVLLLLSVVIIAMLANLYSRLDDVEAKLHRRRMLSDPVMQSGSLPETGPRPTPAPSPVMFRILNAAVGVY